MDSCSKISHFHLSKNYFEMLGENTRLQKLLTFVRKCADKDQQFNEFTL